MISVDQNKCIGCQTCAMMCPDTFAIQDSGLAHAISQEITDCSKNARESCPVGAISIE